MPGYLHTMIGRGSSGKWRLLVGLLWVCFVSGGPAFSGELPAPPANLWTTTGERIVGQWVESTPTQVTWRAGEQVRTIAAPTIWQVALPSTIARPARPQFWLHLTNGDRWGVSSLKLADEKLEFQLALDSQLRSLGIEFVAGIQPLRPGTSWKTDESEWGQVANRRAKTDLAVLRNGDHQTGEVSEISETAFQLSGSQGKQALEWSAVTGLVMNPDLAEKSPPPTTGWTVLLADESSITATDLIRTADGQWTLTAINGVGITTAPGNVRWATHWGESAVALSRIPVAKQTHLPLLGDAIEVTLDRNVRGLPLRSAAEFGAGSQEGNPLPTLSPTGIGLSSGMTVQWKLEGAYRRLQCGLGLDATACAEGHAVVTIKVDDRLQKQFTLRAGEPIQLETSIDLTGAQSLSIETDFGENGDACDWINLYTPILVR